MKTKVVAKNFEMTDDVQKYLDKRISKFDKLLGGVDDVFVTINGQKLGERVEITIPLNSVILRGEHEDTDVFTCIDAIVEKLESQVRKHKTRLARRMKEGSENKRSIMEIPEELHSYDLVRRKTFSQKPFSLEEAMMQMDLLGHDFFAYVDQDTLQVNVLYRRKQGNYGLLEPEL